jgi:drug/metabolite transporter (DMT)-like permease
MKSPASPLNWLLFALLVVAWGSSFAMTKLAVASIDPNWIMALRIAIAAIILVPLALFTGHGFAQPPSAWAKFAWLSLSGYVAPFFLISWAMQFVSSGIAGLLMGSIPLMMVVAAHLFLPNESLTPRKILGFVLGFLGITVLMLPKASFGDFLHGEALMGELAIILGCVCYVAHSITAKRMGFHDPVLQTAAVCLVGAGLGLAIAYGLAPIEFSAIPAGALWAVIGLGVLPTAFASVVMYRLMERTGPSFVSMSNYLVPVYALLFGAAILDEDIGWNVLVALGLVLLGIAISRRKRRENKRAEISL